MARLGSAILDFTDGAEQESRGWPAQGRSWRYWKDNGFQLPW